MPNLYWSLITSLLIAFKSTDWIIIDSVLNLNSRQCAVRFLCSIVTGKFSFYFPCFLKQHTYHTRCVKKTRMRNFRRRFRPPPHSLIYGAWRKSTCLFAQIWISREETFPISCSVRRNRIKLALVCASKVWFDFLMMITIDMEISFLKVRSQNGIVTLHLHDFHF